MRYRSRIQIRRQRQVRAKAIKLTVEWLVWLSVIIASVGIAFA